MTFFSYRYRCCHSYSCLSNDQKNIISRFFKDVAHLTLFFQVGESTVCKKCETKCTCQAAGAIQCKKISCVDGEDCGIIGGVRGCFTKQRRCSVSNKGEFASFDGMSGAIGTKGAFELTSLCDQSNEKWFRVVVDTRVCKRGGSLKVATLYVFYKDATVAVNSQHETWVRVWTDGQADVSWCVSSLTIVCPRFPLPGLIQVNGKKESLPSKLSNDLSIKLKGKTLVIDVTPNVRVTFSNSREVTVITNGVLTNKVCGACGNANDDPKDDMQTADGKVTKDAAKIVASWVAGDFSTWWVT